MEAWPQQSLSDNWAQGEGDPRKIFSDLPDFLVQVRSMEWGTGEKNRKLLSKDDKPEPVTHQLPLLQVQQEVTALSLLAAGDCSHLNPEAEFFERKAYSEAPNRAGACFPGLSYFPTCFKPCPWVPSFSFQKPCLFPLPLWIYIRWPLSNFCGRYAGISITEFGPHSREVLSQISLSSGPSSLCIML